MPAIDPKIAAVLTAHGLTPKDPPARHYRPDQRDWRSIIDAASVAPGQWLLVAEDVATSTATHIRKTYGHLVETRMAGVGPTGSRAAEFYIRYRPEANTEATNPNPNTES